MASESATVSTNVSYDDSSNTVTIYHLGNLDYSAKYAITVSSQVSDASGNRMLEDYSFSFTTANELSGTLSWSNPPPQGNRLQGVWSISENDIFAVGRVGTIIRSDGAAWTVMDSKTNLHLNAVWGSSSNNVYAVGQGGVIMHFNGTVWSLSHLDSEGLELWSIWGSSASDIFVGSDDKILHYNGSGWTEMALPIEARITSIWGFSSNEVYAADIAQKILRYDGTSWSVFKEFQGGDTLLWALWGMSGSDLYTGGYSIFGNDFLFHYDGSDWTLQDDVNETVSAIWGSSADNVYAVGYVGYIMHYDGSSWKDESRYRIDYRAINGTSANNIYVVGDFGIIDHNDGSGWQLQNGTYIWPLYDVLGFAENNIYAVGDMGVVLRYDGSLWGPPVFLDESRPNMGIAASAADSIYVVNCKDDQHGFDGGAIYKFDGANWTRKLDDPDICFTSVWASGDGNVFAVGYDESGDGYISRSEDSGENWGASSKLGRMEKPKYVSGSSKNNVIAVGRNGIAMQFNGDSWSEMDTGTSATINSVLVLSDSQAYATDENGLFISYDGNTDRVWTLIGRVANRPITKIWGTSGDDLFLVVNVDTTKNVGGNDLIVHYDGSSFSQTESIADQSILSAWGVSGDSIYFVGSFGIILHYER